MCAVSRCPGRKTDTLQSHVVRLLLLTPLDGCPKPCDSFACGICASSPNQSFGRLLERLTRCRHSYVTPRSASSHLIRCCVRCIPALCPNSLPQNGQLTSVAYLFSWLFDLVCLMVIVGVLVQRRLRHSALSVQFAVDRCCRQTRVHRTDTS